MRICLKDALHRSCGKIFRVRVGTSKICEQNINPSWILLQQETMEEVAVTAGNTQFFKRPDALPVAHSTQSRQTSGQKSVEKSTGYGSKIQNIIRITLKSSVSEILDTKKNLTMICSQILCYPAHTRRNNKHVEKETTCEEHAWQRCKRHDNCAVYVYKE